MATLEEILTRRLVAAAIHLPRPASPDTHRRCPALGQSRLNLMAFCKDFNAQRRSTNPILPWQ
ncbi:putative ribosomal protein L11 [Rosa chinensis]|uniref:Putative ribosomal protein L11 n=1 Tax=Rosa chinensis TaxID=74649 RepID=A0A2P6PSJ4_ROSCH|nr:putative ribosomal protein L11 [Rosa chinensis]